MKPCLMLCLLPLAAGLASQSVQTDWQGGPGAEAPGATWGDTFHSCQDISWRSVPGQLALSSLPLSDPVVHFLDMSITRAYTVDAADLNGDGIMDLAGGGDAPDGFCVWYGDGSGGWDRESVNPGAGGVTGCDIADINGDGHKDLLCATYVGKEVLLYLSDGSSSPQWTEHVISSDFDGAHDVEAFDMDGDGDLDVLAAAAEADRVTWWRNDGGSPIQWHEQDISTEVNYPCRIQALDLNEDGCIDVVASMWLDGSVVSWYGSGGGNPQWTEELVYHPISGAHSVRACDVDEDGDQDLIVSALGGGNLILMRNGGGTPLQWTREYVSTQASCGYARPGDVDGDGDWDIVSCSFGTGGAWWYENDGSGAGWTQHEIAGGSGSMACSLPADMDGDGDLDAVITCYDTDRILVCEMTEFSTSGWLKGCILDTGGSPQWASIDWESADPSGTVLGVSYRTADDPGQMGEWSAPLYAPSELSGLVDRYFQYRIEMETSDPGVSPLLHSIQFNWDLTGIHGHGPEQGIRVSVAGGNPVSGAPVLIISTGIGTGALLRLYDCAGRAAWAAEVSLPPGTASMVQVPAIPAGSYRLLCSGSEGAQQVLSMVVLDR